MPFGAFRRFDEGSAYIVAEVVRSFAAYDLPGRASGL